MNLIIVYMCVYNRVRWVYIYLRDCNCERSISICRIATHQKKNWWEMREWITVEVGGWIY